MGFRLQFVWPVAIGTLGLVALCVFTAVSLFHQQATVTGVLRENVSSRRAAADLRGCLNTLIALETHQVESVADLHLRAQLHLSEIRQHADQAQERIFADQLDAGFARYLELWQALPPINDSRHAVKVSEAVSVLETQVLYPCREIEAYNDRRVDETTEQLERVLNRLAWGMAVVAGLGAVAGVILGYGVARLLSQSIQRLRVQIRDAAGKLGADAPEIVLTGDGGFGRLHADIDVLSERIEQVVQALQEREREIMRSEQLAAVGQLAAGAGHELRNPLTSIKLLVQSALEDPTRSTLTTEDLQIIESEIRRMERSLQTFLDFARPPKAEYQPVELGIILQAVVGLTRGRAERQRITTQLNFLTAPVTLTADPAQLRQVFVNLVLNALDAMPSGGTLTITIRQHGHQVEIEVADTGPGIAREILPRLFQPFASSKETGLGLGLVISRRIVQDHGGTLEATNRPGGGASFFVRLPIASPGRPRSLI